MKKYLTLISSFLIMLSLGGVYAWSIFSTELMLNYNWSSTQTQLVFGTLIAVFPITMVLVGKNLIKNLKFFGILSSLFFFVGYIISGLSKGNFYFILVGIGFLAGIGTGIGYITAITIPVKWFPNKKGLITGVIAAGFGLAAVILSTIIEYLLNRGYNIFDIFTFIGIVYSLVILFFSFFIFLPKSANLSQKLTYSNFAKSINFYKLFIGIFLGTFAGLLIIGSLKPIGIEFEVKNHHQILAVSLFAVANFLGRIVWGYLSDLINGNLTIFLSLLFQSLFIFILGNTKLSSESFVIISSCIGFGFGSNFVLFAKETSQIFGLNNLASIYPYVFLGYAIAGIFGPLTGGILYDLNKNYFWAINVASFTSAIGGFIFLHNYFLKYTNKKNLKVV